MTDLFDENENNNEQPKTDGVVVDNSVLDLFADKLLAIKKEDGTPKYDTLEKALDALAASQAYIPRLEDENKTLKEKAARAAELEELVKKMSNGNTDTGKPDGNNPPVNGGLDAQSAAELVRNILKEEKQVSTAIQNVTNVQNKLVELYGEAGAVEALNAKAKELGTTKAKLKELSAENPNMVLALFGKPSGGPSATTSSINGGAIRAPEPEIKRPDKSLISGVGATDKARMEFMRQIKERVNKRLGVTT